MDEDAAREALQAAREAIERADRALTSSCSGAQDPQDPQDARSKAETLFRQRRHRDRCFPPGLFAEPEWDMLLALFQSEQAEMRQIDVFNQAGVPHTTGLRIMVKLEQAGLVERKLGGGIYRKRLVSLTACGVERMKQAVAA